MGALADKFDVVQDDRLEVGRTHPFGARVSITTDDGVHERLYADPSGEPSSFPDAQAMQQKFLTLARPVLQGRADQLADAILTLEQYRSRGRRDASGKTVDLSRRSGAAKREPKIITTGSDGFRACAKWRIPE